MIAFLLALACSKPEPLPCAAGFELNADDGRCYQIVEPEDSDTPDDSGTTDDTAPDDTADSGDTGDTAPTGPTIQELLDALPPCERRTGTTRLDLLLGCADNVCAGMPYESFAGLLEDPGECVPATWTPIVTCRWADRGMRATFADQDFDGVPDLGAGTSGITLERPYDGTSPEGLGLDVPMRCFVDEYGFPDVVEFRQTPDETYVLSSLSYYDEAIFVRDLGDPPTSYVPDGAADWLYIYRAR